MSHQPICVILFLTLASCSGESTPKPAVMTDSVPMRPASSDSGMRLEAMAMLPAVRAQVDSFARSPSMMRSAGSRYQTEIKHVVEAMHTDMTRLGMHSDPAYEALADSVVHGSAALSTAGGADFERLVARHVDQVRRLSAVYETKVAAMK